MLIRLLVAFILGLLALSIAGLFLSHVLAVIIGLVVGVLTFERYNHLS